MLDVKSSLFCGLRVNLQRIRVKRVYEGHQVEAKVTGTKKREFPISAMQKTLNGNYD